MRIAARAKINWTLDIVGKREDGYHLMDMLMQPISLSDDITLLPQEELTLSVSGFPRVNPGPENLALRAARLLKQATGYTGGASIHVHKRIPIGAGMGGGSADAAGVLAGLNRLWSTGLTQAELETLGLQLGADVPFCLRGGLQRAQGVGELLTPLPCGGLYWLVVIQPCPGLSTKEVFSRFSLEACEGKPDTQGAAEALAQGDWRRLCSCLGNVLQAVSAELRPEISEAIAALRAQGAAGAWMTGSGSAVFGLFTSAPAARAAAQSLRPRWRSTCMSHTCMESIDEIT